MRSSTLNRPPKRVLIVDHHELVRRGLAALVNAEPDMVSCGEVAGTAATLEAVKRLRPDVVLIDVSLARGAGLESIQCIRRLDAGIRIVALAMSEHPEMVERISSAGAATLVLQSNLATRVLQAIRRVEVAAAASDAAGAGRPEISRGDGGFDAMEREIVRLIGDGVATRAIAIRLGLSVAMVEAYRRRIRRKLNFPPATQLVQFCVQWVEENRAVAAQD